MAGQTLPPAPPAVAIAHQPDHPAFGFYASSRRLDPTKAKGPEALGPQGPRDEEAWKAYDEVSEVGTLVDDPAALLSQCRLYAGWQDADLNDHRLRDEDGTPVEGFPEQFVADCESTMARVSDPGGSQRGLIFAQAQNMSVTGDAYLVGWSIDQNGQPVEEADRNAVGERWEVVSRGAVDRKRNRWTIQLSGMKATVLPESAVVYRMWNRHPRRPDDPRSWLVRNLDVVRDLRIFTLAARAAGRSSIPGSVWVVAEEASPKMVAGQTAGGPGVVPPGAVPGAPAVPPGFPPGFGVAPAPGSPPLTPEAAMTWGQRLEHLLGAAIMEAVGDANSGRTIVPSVLTVTKEYVKDGFNQLDLARDIDGALQGFIELARTRLAEAAQAPPEMLKGLGETNRWNGAQIADDEFRRYFKPGADAIADAWTVEILWGGLRALGHPEELIRRVRVLVDPKGVVAEPDESALAMDLYDRGQLSGEALRRRCKIPPEDAPTPEEQEFIATFFGRRQSAGRASGKGEVNTKAGSAAPIEVEVVEVEVPGPVQAAATPEPVEEPDPIVTRRPALGKLRARTAASIETTPTGEELAEQLALIDQSARDRLEEAAEMALDAALSRAGAKLRTWARKDQDLRALLAPVVDQRGVLAALGPDRARQIAAAQFASDDERRDDLFAAALVALLASFDRITTGALTQALRLLAVAVVETGEEPPAWARASVPGETIMAASLAGAEVLRSSMMLLADARVFEPATVAPGGGTAPAGAGPGVVAAVGETSSLQVPPTVIAAALAAAGGTPVVAGLMPQREAAQGLVWGPRLRAFLPPILGWQWDYGTLAERRTPWLPHEAVDGHVFSGPDDPDLAGLAPGGGVGFPGDHRGCRCRWMAVLADPTW